MIDLSRPAGGPARRLPVARARLSLAAEPSRWRGRHIVAARQPVAVCGARAALEWLNGSAVCALLAV